MRNRIQPDSKEPSEPDLLLSKNVPADLVRRTAAFLKKCDEARFSPETKDDDLAGMVADDFANRNADIFGIGLIADPVEPVSVAVEDQIRNRVDQLKQVLVLLQHRQAGLPG